MSNTTDSTEQQGAALEGCPFCPALLKPFPKEHLPTDLHDVAGEWFQIVHNAGCYFAILGFENYPIHQERLKAWNTRSRAGAAPADVTNTGLHCNGCGILIEGWPNVYRCVTSGCGRIYHYQCLLKHCASDHLCQNCKRSYKPYVLHCDQCGAEAFDCCLSKPCAKCGSVLAADTGIANRDFEDSDWLVRQRDIAREREQEASRELPDAIAKAISLRDRWRKRKHETSGNTSDNYATMFLAANQILATLGAAVCAGCGIAITNGQATCSEKCLRAVEELGEQ